MCPAALEATLLPPPPVHSLAESREVKAQITPGVAFPWSPFQNPALARLVHSGSAPVQNLSGSGALDSAVTKGTRMNPAHCSVSTLEPHLAEKKDGPITEEGGGGFAN